MSSSPAPNHIDASSSSGDASPPIPAASSSEPSTNARRSPNNPNSNTPLSRTDSALPSDSLPSIANTVNPATPQQFRFRVVFPHHATPTTGPSPISGTTNNNSVANSSTTNVPPTPASISAAHDILNHPSVLASIARHAARRDRERTSERSNTSETTTPVSFSPQSGDNPSQPRANGISPSIPEQQPSAGQQRQMLHTLNHEQNTNLTMTFSTGPASSSSSANLPKLLPQPCAIPMHHETREEAQKRQMFECSICFEYMEDPSGCGSCSSRFCYACLLRVLRTSPTNNNHHKCPCCRADYSLETIRHDLKMRCLMEEQEYIPCAQTGCSTLLSMEKVKSHEEMCPYRKMKCKYAPFGCDWVGPRLGIEDHDKECLFEKMSGLVEQVRLLRAMLTQRVGQLSHQVAVGNHLLQTQNNSLREIQFKNPHNVFHILEFVYTAICHPVTFIQTIEVWKRFSETKGRASLYFYLYWCPLLVFVFRIMVEGVFHFFLLKTDKAHSSNIHENQSEPFLVLRAFFTFFFMLCSLLSFFSDWSGNTTTWKLHTWKSITYPFYRDITALSLLATCYTTTFNFNNTSTSNHNDSHENTNLTFLLQLLKWMVIAFPTFVMPSAIQQILTIFRNTTATSVQDQDDIISRSTHVLIFGMRYGFIASIVGWVPLLDATLWMRFFYTHRTLVLPMWPSQKGGFEDLLKYFNAPCCRYMVIVRIAVMWHSSSFETIRDMLMIATVILGADHLVECFKSMGKDFGSGIVNDALGVVRGTRENRDNVGHLSTRVGVFTFFTWAVSFVYIWVM